MRLVVLIAVLFAACSQFTATVCEDYGLMVDGDTIIHQAFLPIGVTCETPACDAAVDFWFPYAAHDLDGYHIEYADLPVPGRTWLYYSVTASQFYNAGEIREVEIYIADCMLGHPAESMVIAHEIGHALGLDHDTCYNSVMTPGKLRSIADVVILPGDLEVLNDQH